MNVYDNGWHWQILHNIFTLSDLRWSPNRGPGLRNVVQDGALVPASYGTSSVRPRTTKHVSGNYSGAQMRSADETRVSEGKDSSHAVTLGLNIRLVSVFSSAMYVAVAGMSHCTTMFMVTPLGILQTALGCYTCVNGTVRTCYVFPLVTQYKNNSKLTY
jgi:hypothetical protein